MTDHSLEAALLSLVTMTCWGVSNALMKIPSIRLGAPKAIRLKQNTIVPILIIYKICFDSLEIGDNFWILIAFALGVFGYIPFYYFCQALRLGAVGIVNSIGNSFPVITAILCYLILDIEIGTDGIIGIFVSTLGILILSTNRNKQISFNIKSENHAEAIFFASLACLFWGLFYTIAPLINKHLDVITFSICLHGGTLLSSYLHSMKENKRQNLYFKTLIFAVLAGITGVVGSICFYTALHIGNAGISTAIAGSSPVVGAISGWLIYKEKINRMSALGIIISIIGVIILSLSRH